MSERAVKAHKDGDRRAGGWPVGGDGGGDGRPIRIGMNLHEEVNGDRGGGGGGAEKGMKQFILLTRRLRRGR